MVNKNQNKIFNPFSSLSNRRPEFLLPPPPSSLSLAFLSELNLHILINLYSANSKRELRIAETQLAGVELSESIDRMSKNKLYHNMSRIKVNHLLSVPPLILHLISSSLPQSLGGGFDSYQHIHIRLAYTHIRNLSCFHFSIYQMNYMSKELLRGGEQDEPQVVRGWKFGGWWWSAGEGSWCTVREIGS